MFDNIKLLRIDPREYYQDILGLIAVGLITNWFSFKLVVFIKSLRFLPLSSDYDYFPLTITYLNVAFWLIVYLFLRKYFLLKARPIIYKLSGKRFLENRFSLDMSRFDKEWEFQGNVQVLDEGISVTNTPSGCLIKNNYWDTRVWEDFSASLKVNFEKYIGLENDYFQNNISYLLKAKKVEFRKVIGVIFRAQNLDDHFMLGVMVEENSLIFRPHVRVAGNLDIPLRNSAGSTFKTAKSISSVQLKILVRQNELKVFLNQGKKWVYCYYWLLPSFYKINLSETQQSDSDIVTRKIYFKNLPGMFGFRNYGNELALVKDLKINGNFSIEEERLFCKQFVLQEQT